MGVALIVAAIACALAAPAAASSTEVSILMDDDQLIYVPQQHMVQTLNRLASLGVDVVKVSLVWQLIAPNPYSTRRPHFNATDPAAYPSGAWTRYDELVEAAQRLGMKVYFLIAPPSPEWAWAGGLPRGQGESLGQAPNPKDLQNFVQAVGKRYSGTYVDPGSDSTTTSTATSSTTTTTTSTATLPMGGVGLPDGTQPSGGSGATSGPPAIPRVSYWGIWNEPNFPSWLNPWHMKVGGVDELTQPSLYRGLVNAAWNGLSATGHAHDTILIGETANFGNIEPVPFVRDLYCVDNHDQPLAGTAARHVGCPASPDRSKFEQQNPGLFAIGGYAHHPYAFDYAPNRPYRYRSWVTLQNIGWLEQVMDGIFSGYGVHPPGGVPLYLTEWGYVTNPPNPYAHTTLSEQATWLDEGDYMTWRDPYVRSLAQFLLVDDKPRANEPKGSVLYWHTFTTGLLFQNGRSKPALQSYRLPIWLPVQRHGSRVMVWGQLRPVDHQRTGSGVIEFEAHGSSHWTTLTQVQTRNPEGYLVAHVSIPSAGDVRLGRLYPGGTAVFSRSVPVT